jgi:hypothetical protein
MLRLDQLSCLQLSYAARYWSKQSSAKASLATRIRRPRNNFCWLCRSKSWKERYVCIFLRIFDWSKVSWAIRQYHAPPRNRTRLKELFILRTSFLNCTHPQLSSPPSTVSHHFTSHPLNTGSSTYPPPPCHILKTTMAVTSLETLVNQVEQLAASADLATRIYLRNTLRDLQYKLEGPNDTINRFGYYVNSRYKSYDTTRSDLA